jgi:DNA-binding protein HU-beta
MAKANTTVMRKRQLAQALAEKTGSKLKEAQAIVEFIFDEIATAMVKGTKVNIQDFGIFVKAQRKARMGRNPATGEAIKIKASVKPRFTPSKALKEAMPAKKYECHADEDTLTAMAGDEAPAKKTTKKKTTKKKTTKKR